MARRLGQSGSPGPPPGLRSWADPADLVRSARRKSARDSGQFGIGSARQHSRTPGRDSARGSVPARSRWGQLHDPHGPAACVRSAGHHRVRHGLGRGGRFGRPVENSFLVFGLLAPNRTLRATENPRVAGSIPALATISNSMIRNGFRVSPADYLCPDGTRPADYREVGGATPHLRPRCRQAMSGAGSRRDRAAWQLRSWTRSCQAPQGSPFCVNHVTGIRGLTGSGYFVT